MSRKKSTSTITRRLLARRKEHYTVPEVAPALAEVLEITEAGARSRIYRAVDAGHLRARRHLGAIRIPYAETERILRGETL